MLVVQDEIPFTGALLVAVPLPKKTGCVASFDGAIHTLNCGGTALSAASASMPPTVAGDKVTFAVALLCVLGVMVNRPPMQGLLSTQTLKLYLLTFSVPLT